MKKALLLAMMLLLLICVISCQKSDDKKIVEDEPDEADVQETQAVEELPLSEVFEEVSFLYTDADFDLFIMIDSSKLAYTKELYPGSVYFYPADTDPETSPNGFALSSQEITELPLTDAWEASRPNLEATIAGFEWIQEEPVNVGIYTGERYHFWGEGARGDYIIWETQSLLYTCSLTAQEADYYKYLDLVLESLETFSALSEMPFG